MRDTLFSICAMALFAYGLVSLVLDLRRLILWVGRGIRDGIRGAWQAVARHWRAWLAARERRRAQRRDSMVAKAIDTMNQLGGLLATQQLELQILKAELATRGPGN